MFRFELNVFDSSRSEVAEVTKKMPTFHMLKDDTVYVHRCHQLRQVIIVAAMIPVPLDPTTPVNRS